MCNNPAPVHTETYKGKTIAIHYDQTPSNPFDEFDGELPIAVYGDGSLRAYATKYGDVSEPPELTYDQIQANKSDIADICGFPSWHQLTKVIYCTWELAREVNAMISEELREVSDSRRLERLEALYIIAGMPCLRKTVRGYVQRDWAEVLVVVTPEFLQATGCKIEQFEDDKELEQAAKLYADWAFGNVYGFVIEDEDGNEVEDGSCWGFFGDYDNDAYSALSEARKVVDSLMQREAREAAESEARERAVRIAQVKAWIKNRVPLVYRHLAI